MELDKFRNVDLVINHVNDNFFFKQFVSQNDNNGRTLTVQVTSDGIVGKVPGLKLNLRWSNQTNGLTDLSAFELIDENNSIFQIKYPINMLNPGKVVAAIQIVQNGQVAHSKQFEITVQQLAGEMKGIVSSAEYSALVQTLSDANKFRTDIDTLADSKADWEDLNQTDANLDALNQKKADKTSLSATNAQVASLNSNKVDRGGVSQVSWGMLDQEAKENISGGKTAVVGIDGVSTENIVAQSVTTEKTNFASGKFNIANPSKIKLGYRFDLVEGKIKLVDDQNYNSILIDVDKSLWYSLNSFGYSTNFSWACSAEMVVNKKISELEHDGLYILKTTENTRFLAISALKSNDLTKLICIQTDEKINDYKVENWPYNVAKSVEIPELIVEGEPLKNLKNPGYQNVVSKKSEILNATVFTLFGGGSIVGNIWSGSEISEGMYTQFFESNKEDTYIDIDVDVNMLSSVDVMLRYRNSADESKYIVLYESTASFKTTLSFDASNLAIYNDAKDFAIVVRNRGTIEGSFAINELLVYSNETQKLSFYAENLEDTLLKLDVELKNLEPDNDIFLTAPNGKKFKLLVDNNGALHTKSSTFSKVNISGNSLVNGISQGTHGTKDFGMCASDSKHDFNYLVQQAILAKNTDATFTQTQISGIEMATNQAEYEAYRDSIANSYTADTDLIILQIGDNTTQYIETFENTFPQFLGWLKGKCPIADIVVVGTWFSVATGYPVVKQTAIQAGVTFVDISALNTAENQGSVGMTITFDDGTVETAKDSWIRHPGDVGMKKIADKIIERIGI